MKFAIPFGLLLTLLLSISTVCAQRNSDVEIVLDDKTELQNEGRKQLRRLLSEHDLSPWIFTRKVKIDSDIVPSSHPILTLDTEYASKDSVQLSMFLHEQAHWAVAQQKAEGKQAIELLKKIYPNPPSHVDIGSRAAYSEYLHLIICWMELDGLAEFIGEQCAREMMSQREDYEWAIRRVLRDTRQIGAVISEHNLLITPEKGLGPASKWK